uniref:Transposase n=1 Tax=Chenopodium quinoa TaxID=63459 RepID=A0A803MRE4_CHEQI
MVRNRVESSSSEEEELQMTVLGARRSQPLQRMPPLAIARTLYFKGERIGFLPQNPLITLCFLCGFSVLHEGNYGLEYNRLGINTARRVIRRDPSITPPSARAPALRPSQLEIVKPIVAAAAAVKPGVFAVNTEHNAEPRGEAEEEESSEDKDYRLLATSKEVESRQALAEDLEMEKASHEAETLRLVSHLDAKDSDLSAMGSGGLSGTRNMTLQEIVAMFLYTLAHHQKNRSIGNLFLRSGKTVSRQFNLCLRAILELHEHLLHKPIAISNECEDERWQPFKSCLGALDGTYINVRVTSQERGKYRTRKGTIAMNVLGACAPNMEFIYVLHNALSRPNGLRVPRGNYYLVDAGYTNCDGFLTPYRGQQYHLKEWTDKQPESAEEYFNMKHARARNVVERRVMPTDDIEEEELSEDSDDDSDDEPEYITSVATSDQWTNFRNTLAQDMFNGWRARADPHIESRIKHWTEKYSAMAEMLSTSGFGWDSDKKMLQVEKTVFDEWAKVDDANELVASLHNTSKTFGKIFEDINANLGTMANSWSKAEEREKKMDDEVDKVLEEVMKLDGVSLSESLERYIVDDESGEGITNAKPQEDEEEEDEEIVESNVELEGKSV